MRADAIVGVGTTALLDRLDDLGGAAPVAAHEGELYTQDLQDVGLSGVAPDLHRLVGEELDRDHIAARQFPRRCQERGGPFARRTERARNQLSVFERGPRALEIASFGARERRIADLLAAAEALIIEATS